jgi:hypothetical protein
MNIKIRSIVLTLTFHFLIFGLSAQDSTKLDSNQFLYLRVAESNTHGFSQIIMSNGIDDLETIELERVSSLKETKHNITIIAKTLKGILDSGFELISTSVKEENITCYIFYKNSQ